ncbi:MAG: hypothetical protein IKR48_11880 [Kiritimatiellae bacterium]|nr:hypothetical protein [Kiritimatiellia bacterium]
MSATNKNNRRNAIRYLLAGFMAVATSGTPPALAADWTDTNNATYTALRSINGGATDIATGGGWIVTDITPTCTDTVKIRFRLHDTWTQTLWCGRGTTTTSATFTGFFLDNVIRCDRNANAGAKGATTPGTANDCTVVANYDTCQFLVNDEVQGAMMASGNYNVGSALMLFGSHTKGTDLSDLIAAEDVDNRGSYDLYYFQLYSSAGALTHNLMPAARDSDGAVGLFDTVTSNFYAKATNSGDFTSEAKTVVTGTPVKWTGLGGDNNMSNPANWEGGVVPVAGQDLDFTIATPLVPINADINATFGNVWLGDVEKTTFTGTLTANDVNNRSMLEVADGATVTLLNVVASAIWTGTANNGEFYDPDNWTCLNEVGTPIAGAFPHTIPPSPSVRMFPSIAGRTSISPGYLDR